MSLHDLCTVLRTAMQTEEPQSSKQQELLNQPKCHIPQDLKLLWCQLLRLHSISDRDEWMSVQNWWTDNDGENQSTGNKTCLSATLFTKNVTWSDLGSNPGIHGLKKQNMFVDWYLIIVQFPFGMHAVICHYLGKGGGWTRFCHVVPNWNFILLLNCVADSNANPTSLSLSLSVCLLVGILSSTDRWCSVYIFLICFWALSFIFPVCCFVHQAVCSVKIGVGCFWLQINRKSGEAALPQSNYMQAMYYGLSSF